MAGDRNVPFGRNIGQAKWCRKKMNGHRLDIRAQKRGQNNIRTFQLSLMFHYRYYKHCLGGKKRKFCKCSWARDCRIHIHQKVAGYFWRSQQAWRILACYIFQKVFAMCLTHTLRLYNHRVFCLSPILK